MIADPRLDGVKIINDYRTREGHGFRTMTMGGTLDILDDPADAYSAHVPQDGIDETPPPFPARTTASVKVIIDRDRFERMRNALLKVLDCHPDAALDVLDIIRDGDSNPIS